MNYKLASIGLAALATTAIASPASAMPNGLPLNVQPQNNAEQVRYVCDWRGRCWWRPGRASMVLTRGGRAGVVPASALAPWGPHPWRRW